MAGQVHPSAPDAAMLQYNNKMSQLPPPATYNAKARYHHRGHRGGLAGCCCCLLSTFCSLLLAFLFLAGLTILILWLVLKPVHLPKYSLDNVEVRNFALTGSTLNADIAYNITANNPNRKIGIKYDTINLDTSYSGQALGRSVIPGFYQGHQNVTSLSSELKVQNASLTPTSASALTTQLEANSVPMHVRADAKVHARIGKYTSPGFWVRVDCDVNMSVNPATVISKSCKLKRRS